MFGGIVPHEIKQKEGKAQINPDPSLITGHLQLRQNPPVNLPYTLSEDHIFL